MKVLTVADLKLYLEHIPDHTAIRIYSGGYESEEDWAYTVYEGAEECWGGYDCPTGRKADHTTRRTYEAGKHIHPTVRIS